MNLEIEDSVYFILKVNESYDDNCILILKKMDKLLLYAPLVNASIIAFTWLNTWIVSAVVASSKGYDYGALADKRYCGMFRRTTMVLSWEIRDKIDELGPWWTASNLTTDLGLLVQVEYELNKSKFGIFFYFMHVIVACYTIFNLFYNIIRTPVYRDLDYTMVCVSIIMVNRTICWVIASLGIWAPKKIRLVSLWISTIFAMCVEFALLIYPIYVIVTIPDLKTTTYAIIVYVVVLAELWGIAIGIVASIYDYSYLPPLYILLPAAWYALGFILPLVLSIMYFEETTGISIAYFF